MIDVTVYCDKCGEEVDDIEKILFDCALCNECYNEVEKDFERWLKGE